MYEFSSQMGILCFQSVKKIIVFWKYDIDGCSGLCVSFAFETLQLECIHHHELLSQETILITCCAWILFSVVHVEAGYEYWLIETWWYLKSVNVFGEGLKLLKP